MINVGILSFAHLHAHSYASCLQSMPNASLTAIYDDDAKRGRAAVRDYGGKYFADLEKFLAQDLQAVIICSENVNHRPHAVAAAEAKKPILCEKPIATTLADARAMIQAAQRNRVSLSVAYPCRYAPPIIETKKQIQSGALGQLLAMTTTNNGQNPGGWFTDPKLSGGGATVDHTVHMADLLRWMTGTEFSKVYCTQATVIDRSLKTDDLGILHIEMQGGLKIAHTASWNRPAAFPTWGDITMDIAGTKGSLYVDAFNEKIDVYSNKASRAQWAPYGTNIDLALLSDFISAIENDVPASITAEDGLQTLKLTLAAQKSAKQRQFVRV